MFDRLSHPRTRRVSTIVALLLLLSGPASALVLVTTHDGASYRGTPTNETLAIALDRGGTATWPPAAFAEITSTGDATRVRAVLKNGEAIEGRFTRALHLHEGLRRITIAPEELASARFDPYLDLDEKVDVCPIRGQVDVTQEIEKKAWRIGRPRNLSCDGTAINLIDVTRRKASVRQPRGERRPGQKLKIETTIWVAAGNDLHGHLRIELLQAKKVIASASRDFEGDEAEMNKVQLELWVADDERRPGSATTLRFQLVTVDENQEPKLDPVYRWLVMESDS